jgi:hypothetical protein
LVVGHVVRQLHETDVRVGDAGLLGLEAVETARVLGTAEERRPGPVGVRVVALRVVARAAVRAGAAGDRRRNHHAVADVEVADVVADLLDAPTPSWPRIRPSSTPGIVPRTKCRSVPQIALAVSRTIASVGSWIVGSGTSSSRMSPTRHRFGAVKPCGGPGVAD